jgi:ribosomal protein S18 acetylase RimI-like enzyme
VSAAELDVTIRQADLQSTSDAADVLWLLNHYAEDPMGSGQSLPAEVQQRLIEGLRAHPTTLIFLAFQAGSAVGIATCFVGFSTFAARPLVNVHDLAVHRDYQGRGIGRKLLQHVLDAARQRGAVSVTLEVRRDNLRGRKLYSQLGFRYVEPESPGEELPGEAMLFARKFLDG